MVYDGQPSKEATARSPQSLLTGVHGLPGAGCTCSLLADGLAVVPQVGPTFSTGVWPVAPDIQHRCLACDPCSPSSQG